MSLLRRTPCVGICSTTYGDLVCRGCKRFAHEIVQWNGFAAEQRVLVWNRLHALRGEAAERHMHVVDTQCLTAVAIRLQVPEHELLNPANLAFEVLRRVARRQPTLLDLGIDSIRELDPITLLETIENDFYQRSLAEYEHSFRTLAQ